MVDFSTCVSKSLSCNPAHYNVDRPKIRTQIARKTLREIFFGTKCQKNKLYSRSKNIIYADRYEIWISKSAWSVVTVL